MLVRPLSHQSNKSLCFDKDKRVLGAATGGSLEIIRSISEKNGNQTNKLFDTSVIFPFDKKQQGRNSIVCFKSLMSPADLPNRSTKMSSERDC